MTTSHIRKEIFNTANGEMFCNRQFLRLASRSTIDKTLSLMAHAGDIVRLAFGVYVRNRHDLKIPSLHEIAEFKAKVFGRRLVATKANAAKECALSTDCGDGETIYLTDGHTTSFKTIHGQRIRLRRAAARLIHIGNGWIAQSIKALWFFGKPLDRKLLWKAVSELKRTQRKDLQNEAMWMPSWMADTVTSDVWRPSSAGKRYPVWVLCTTESSDVKTKITFRLDYVDKFGRPISDTN